VSPTVRPVILSGGAGTRLWPLSTDDHPKQFLRLLDQPLFESTLLRLVGMEMVDGPLVVTGRDQLEFVDSASRSSGVELGDVIVEPVGRNTAAAVVAAALVSDPGDVLVVLPADHVIGDQDGFRSAVGQAIALAQDGAMVTFGATPLRPETGYGYLEMGEQIDGAYRVARFKEKPDADEAERLIADGRHLWNSGMFVFTAAHLLDEARAHSPEVVRGVESSLPAERSGRIILGEAFARVPSVSIDHAIMERTSKAVVIPIDVGWSDLGTWRSLWELSRHDQDGNVKVGRVTALDVTNSYLHAGSRRLALAGVDGLIVVETPEVVLVLPMDRSQLVRELAVSPEPELSPD
jgi:mannose-1-phosphate guanylyltransferase/mannose-6-phosphate isomerase